MTGEHPFYTKSGWKKVKDLKIGELVFINDDGWQNIHTKEKIKGVFHVATLSMYETDEPTFIANDYVVHNKNSENAWASFGVCKIVNNSFNVRVPYKWKIYLKTNASSATANIDAINLMSGGAIYTNTYGTTIKASADEA